MKEMEGLNSDWRKVATTIYKKPIDSKIFGETELDVTELEKYISELRKNGLKVTMTHVFAKIIADGLANETPELNVFSRRGKIVARKQIDALISVLQTDGGMSSVKVECADQLSLTEIVDKTRSEIISTRKGEDKGMPKSKNFLARLPWPFRSWFFSFYQLITIKLGLSIPGVGLNPNSFGSFILTNIGSIGLDKGYPALMPSSNLAFVAVLGGIAKKPVVIDDEIVIRRMMSVSMVLDHRIADASSGGRLLRYIKYRLRKLELIKV